MMSTVRNQALQLTMLLAGCAHAAQGPKGYTTADDPHLLGPGKKAFSTTQIDCPPGQPCAAPPMPAPSVLNAPPLAAAAPANSAPADALANVATLDPDQPMPKQGVSTDVTLQLCVAAGVMVDARSDLYSSGSATADPRRGGTMPAIVTLAPGGNVITFGAVRGKIGCQHHSAFEADGGNCAGGITDLRPAGAVSGIVARERTLFLTGVFLGDSVGPAPAGLDFSDNATGRTFSDLRPGIGQSFFIGDGLSGTGSGSTQRFHVPQGATKLYLGIADGSLFRGDPGSYGDNTGSIAVTITEQP